MLLSINLKEEFKMLRNILLAVMVLVTISIADSPTQIENKILKLKLEIYKLKEKNSNLQKIIDTHSVKLKEEERRANAIAQLKRDLRKSRRMNSTQVMLLK